jgi:hypothetical protein
MAKKTIEPPDKGQWPSIDMQLTAAKATQGSAFEKFILANQDFTLLRPGESSNDEIGVPLWLRVYWRKQHPESRSPAGPAGDYPEFLHRAEEWMQANQDLLPDPTTWLRASERGPKGKHGN